MCDVLPTMTAWLNERKFIERAALVWTHTCTISLASWLECCQSASPPPQCPRSTVAGLELSRCTSSTDLGKAAGAPPGCREAAQRSHILAYYVLRTPLWPLLPLVSTEAQHRHRSVVTRVIRVSMLAHERLLRSPRVHDADVPTYFTISITLVPEQYWQRNVITVLTSRE